MKAPWTRQGAIRAPALLFVLALLGLFALWMESTPVSGGWGRAGYLNYSAGLTLLFAFALSRLAKPLGLPYITGYLFAGMLAGPYAAQILEPQLVSDLRLSDDLALGIIGLAAGASLNWKVMRALGRRVVFTSFLQVGAVFLLLFVAMRGVAQWFPGFSGLPPEAEAAACLVVSLLCAAQSPSSAIAVVDECGASGTFTETLLGVTILVDIIVICLFPLVLSGAHGIYAPAGGQYTAGLFLVVPELGISLLLGGLSGIGLNALLKKPDADIPLFVLCLAFGVAKASEWLGDATFARWGLAFHLEPLIICMAAGFVTRNRGENGSGFLHALQRISLPVYLPFFSLAGASLRLDALAVMWPLAMLLCLLRAGGLFLGSGLGGRFSGVPFAQGRFAFLAHLSKAGVSIGLAAAASRSLPDIGPFITTLVLAVIAVNQMIGPVALKWVLNRVGEGGMER